MLRAVWFCLTMLLRFLAGLILAFYLSNQAAYLYNILDMISLATVLLVVLNSKNDSYSIAWIIVVFSLPLVGVLSYIIWGCFILIGKRSKRIKTSIDRGVQFLDKDESVYYELGLSHPYRKRLSGFLGRKDFPLYKNTLCEYYPLGELHFDAMLRDIEKAEQFIFLEYFIMESGELWDRFENVLIHKARKGVDVRLMVDDFGSIMSFKKSMFNQLKQQKIKVSRFNDVDNVFSMIYFNNRNHQKIAVIDGNIGYTGGTNIADEYANIYPKHGHWKDTAIRLEGEAVWSLTVTFLQMWDAETNSQSDYNLYRPTIKREGQGFFQPFADGPINNSDKIAETVYQSMIYNAKKYVYITSPYLVISKRMTEALRVSAQGGNDVRIILPKKWDHWYVHMVTQSNYRELLEAGVRIYEYTPGFIHAKTIISDDDHAVIGSINMDYRSFNLHYENAVWICGDAVIDEVKRDVLETFEISKEIKFEDWLQRPWYKNSLQNAMRLFSVVF